MAKTEEDLAEYNLPNKMFNFMLYFGSMESSAINLNFLYFFAKTLEDSSAIIHLWRIPTLFGSQRKLFFGPSSNGGFGGGGGRKEEKERKEE